MRDFRMEIENISIAGIPYAIHGVMQSYSLDNWERGRTVAVKLANLKNLNTGEAKHLELISVWFEINAPLEFHSQLDTYRVDMSKCSQSTMHTALKNEFVMDMFNYDISIQTLNEIESIRRKKDLALLKNSLPSGFMQRRVCRTSIKTLMYIASQRHKHKKDEWKYFSNMFTQLYERVLEIIGTTEKPERIGADSRDMKMITPYDTYKQLRKSLADSGYEYAQSDNKYILSKEFCTNNIRYTITYSEELGLPYKIVFEYAGVDGGRQIDITNLGSRRVIVNAAAIKDYVLENIIEKKLQSRKTDLTELIDAIDKYTKDSSLVKAELVKRAEDHHEITISLKDMACCYISYDPADRFPYLRRHGETIQKSCAGLPSSVVVGQIDKYIVEEFLSQIGATHTREDNAMFFPYEPSKVVTPGDKGMSVDTYDKRVCLYVANINNVFILQTGQSHVYNNIHDLLGYIYFHCDGSYIGGLVAGSLKSNTIGTVLARMQEAGFELLSRVGSNDHTSVYSKSMHIILSTDKVNNTIEVQGEDRNTNYVFKTPGQLDTAVMKVIVKDIYGFHNDFNLWFSKCIDGIYHIIDISKRMFYLSHKNSVDGNVIMKTQFDLGDLITFGKIYKYEPVD